MRRSPHSRARSEMQEFVVCEVLPARRELLGRGFQHDRSQVARHAARRRLAQRAAADIDGPKQRELLGSGQVVPRARSAGTHGGLAPARRRPGDPRADSAAAPPATARPRPARGLAARDVVSDCEASASLVDYPEDAAHRFAGRRRPNDATQRVLPAHAVQLTRANLTGPRVQHVDWRTTMFAAPVLTGLRIELLPRPAQLHVVVGADRRVGGRSAAADAGYALPQPERC